MNGKTHGDLQDSQENMENSIHWEECGWLNPLKNGLKAYARHTNGHLACNPFSKTNKYHPIREQTEYIDITRAVYDERMDYSELNVATTPTCIHHRAGFGL